MCYYCCTVHFYRFGDSMNTASRMESNGEGWSSYRLVQGKLRELSHRAEWSYLFFSDQIFLHDCFFTFDPTSYHPSSWKVQKTLCKKRVAQLDAVAQLAYFAFYPPPPPKKKRNGKVIMT